MLKMELSASCEGARPFSIFSEGHGESGRKALEEQNKRKWDSVLVEKISSVIESFWKKVLMVVCACG